MPLYSQFKIKLRRTWLAVGTLMTLLMVMPSGVEASETAEALLQKGRICLTIAAQTEHDFRAYQRACDYMRQALDKASPEQRGAYQASINQCEGMLDMAKDAYRNVMPLSAWITDLASEFREPYEPAIELAIEQAFVGTVPTIKYLNVNQMPIIPRCFAEGDACDGVTENILTFARSHPGLLSVQNADLASLGFDPKPIRAKAGAPPVETAQQLYQKTKWKHAVLVDVKPQGQALCPLETASADVRAWLWSLESGDVRLLGQKKSATIDGRGLKNHWKLVLLYAALLIGLLAWFRPFIRKEAKRTSTLDRALSSTFGILLGLGFGWAMQDFLLPMFEPIAVEMDAYSFNSSDGIRASLFLYPTALGALIFLAPVALCVALGAITQARFTSLGVNNIKWARVVPLMQLGAGALIVSSIPVSIGVYGYTWAVLLIVPPTLLGLATMRPLSFMSDADAGTGRTLAPMLIAGICWLVYMPIMFLEARQDHVSTTVWLLAGLIAIAAGIVYVLTHEILQTDEGTAEADQEGRSSETVGSLGRPRYVATAARDVVGCSPLQDSEEMIRQVWFVGESGAGKTRCANELLRHLKIKLEAESLIIARGTGERSLEDDSSDNAARTIGFATDVLRRLCPIGKRIEILQEREARMQKTEGVVSAMEGLPLPGVDLLLGMQDEAPPEGMTLNWLAEDMTQAIIDRSGSNHIALFLDDIDQADEDSVILFSRLRERLAARQHELGHPVTWLMTTKVAPSIDEDPTAATPISSALASLGAYSDTILLDGLDAIGTTELMKCTGLYLREAETVDWLLENTQTNLPGELLALIRHMEATELLEEENGRRYVPSTTTLQANPDSLPTDLIDCQRMALERLPVEDRFVLEMAAQCGRRFTASSLAAGLERRPLEILKLLRKIEQHHEFVHDEDQEDIFQFSSEAVRRALRSMTARRLRGAGSQSADAEVVRTFHYQTAKALLDDAPDSPSVDPERLLWHCQRAGKRMRSHALKVSLEAAEHARTLFAWKRVLQFAQTAKELAHGQDVSAHQRAQIIFLEAMARKNLGGQDNRDAAYALFKSLLMGADSDQESAPEFEALQACFEVRYEEKTRDELQELVQWIETWVRQKSFIDPLSPIVSEFYLERAQKEVLEDRNPLPNLQALKAKLEAMASSRNRDLLLARVLQSIADRMSWVDRESVEVIEPYWRRSYELKVQNSDLAGQADTLGEEGTYLLLYTQEYDRALKLFSQALELVKKMGDEGAVSKLLNKAAMTRFKRVSTLGGAEGEAEQRSALEGAQESLAIALKLEREGDILYAAKTVLECAASLGDMDAFDAALVAASDRETWAQFQKLGSMLESYEGLSSLCEDVERLEQLEGIIAMVRALLNERG